MVQSRHQDYSPRSASSTPQSHSRSQSVTPGSRSPASREAHRRSNQKGRSRARTGSDYSATDASLEIRVVAAVLNLLCCCIIPFMGDSLFHKSDSIYVLALCFLGIAWSGPLTLFTGTQMYPGEFFVWQPLEGGIMFVMLQGFGWILYSTATLLCCIILANYHTLRLDLLRGFLTTMVVLSIFSHVVLNVSVNYFEPGGSTINTGKLVLGFLRNGKAFVSAILSVGGALIYIAIDFEFVRNYGFATTLKAVACACFLVAAITTHVLEGAQGTPGYKTYQPLIGGTTFVALQACAWATFAIFLNLTLAIPSTPMPFGYMCLTGLIGFLSQFFLQTSIPHFDRSKQLFTTGQWTSSTIVGLASSVLALLFLMAVAFGSHHGGIRQLLHWLQPGVDQGQALLAQDYPHRTLVIGNVLLFSCAPYVQISAWLQKERFTFVPSTGGAAFLLFQAFGWAFYLLAVLLLPLYATLSLREAVVSITPIAFASQCLVTISIALFDPNNNVGILNNRLANFDANRTLGLLVAVMGCVLMVSLDALDFFAYEPLKNLLESANVGVHRIILALSISCFLLSGFLTQLSGMASYHSFQFFQPFTGGVRFVVRQAIGWTVYAVAMLANCVLLITPEDYVSANGLCTCVGLLGLTSMVILLVSVSFFEETNTSPVIRIKVSWPAGFRQSNLTRAEFAAALAQLNRALDVNDAALEQAQASGATSAVSSGSAQLAHGVAGSKELIPAALTALYNEIELEAEAREEQFTQAVCCLNLSSTQYRTFCFFEMSGLFATAVLFASAESLKAQAAHDEVSATYLDYVFLSALGLSFLVTVLPHFVGGRLKHGSTYRLYQPFIGGIKFVVLQACGIALAATGLVSSLTVLGIGLDRVQMNGALVAIGLMWVVGGGVLFASLEQFDGKLAADGSEDPVGVAGLTRSHINHHLVSIILSLSSCVLYVVADIAIFHLGLDDSWVQPVVVCAWISAVGAVPLTVLAGNDAVPAGLRSENMLLKILGWTLWSFTLMLGCLFVSNQYANADLPSGFATERNSAGTTGPDSAAQNDTGDFKALPGAWLGIQNAGSWLLSTSALGLLAQLTFFMPRIASLHTAGLIDDTEEQSSDGEAESKADKHPSAILHTFLRWAMSSHSTNAMMIVGFITLYAFSDGRMLYLASFGAGLFVLMLFAFPWRTLTTVVQGLCLCVSLPTYFLFFAALSSAVVVLAVIYGITTVVFSLTLRFDMARDSSNGDTSGDGSPSSSGDKPRQRSVFSRNFVGRWLDKSLQLWVVSLCSNLQYLHLMQASIIYLVCVGPFAASLGGMAWFAFRHFLLGTMPSTMLMAILATVSKGKEVRLTVLQGCGVLLTMLLPIIDIYLCVSSPEGEWYPQGLTYALCSNYGLHILYMTSFIGAPHLLQKRKWQWFINWRKFWAVVSRYYPHVIRADLDTAHNSAGVAALRNPDSLFVAGWHPHGVIPVTAAWCTLSAAWRDDPVLKNVQLALASSTINHLVPHMRDMVQWTGGIEVSRASINRALDSHISVCIVPGGQSESIESSSSSRDITLVARHKGFIKVAVRKGVPLLPIFCFGETKLLDNVNMKSLQRRSKKILGFPFPFVPYGLWNFLPIPRSEPVYVVVGTPIVVKQCSDPTDDMIDAVHAQYFGEIRRLFLRHRKAAGYHDSKLVLI